MENISAFYYRYLRYFLAKDDATATTQDKYMALAYAVRSELVDRWIESQKLYHEKNTRRVYYFSAEYVFGRSLRQNIVNLGLEDQVAQASRDLGFSLDELSESEDEFELGNGGKGRLAAAYQEGMATMNVAGLAYGLRYDFGMYRQRIVDNRQVEGPYDWLHRNHPWEIIRPQYACEVPLGGRLAYDDAGREKWVDAEYVRAVPYDFPVPGYHNDTVNTVRLWSSRPTEQFLPDYQNHGDYARACEEKTRSAQLTRILFPDEDVRRATELRIKQQYFFISASIQDLLRRFKIHNSNILDFSKKVVIQLNGSRCAIAVAELMRILLDEEGLEWQRAWEICKETFAYTSHAVAGDNLENWPVYLVESILPRHLSIIYRINQLHLDRACDIKGGRSIRSDLSIIEEGEVKRVRMAYLALIGSNSIAGVSAEQTNMLKKRIFHPVSRYVDTEFHSITNGVAHRRWLISANRPLAGLISEMIGDSWTTRPQDLSRLLDHADDDTFLFRLGDVKYAAKRKLSEGLAKYCDVHIDHEWFCDIFSKKIHPYKRQVLHLLGIVSRWLQLKDGNELGTNRVHIFSGKAAPSDRLSKQIIQLICMVANIVNRDSSTSGKLQIIFVPDYSLSWAEYLVPAADLSEQIATPTMEASGTSNMKYALNGAITLASRAGSNLEMIDRIGMENMIVFGRDPQERSQDTIPGVDEVISQDEDLRRVLDFLDDVVRSERDGDGVAGLLATLRATDDFWVLRDYRDYIEKQHLVDEFYNDRIRWLRMSLASIAKSGWFSIDRAVQEHIEKIWRVAGS